MMDEGELATQRQLVLAQRAWMGKTNHLRSGWHKQTDGEDGGLWLSDRRDAVIWSVAKEADDQWWLHVSLRITGRDVPDYQEMTWLHEAFVGADRIAYQVFAPVAEHVNIHPGVLHLWAPLLHRPTPDFTHGMGTI